MLKLSFIRIVSNVIWSMLVVIISTPSISDAFITNFTVLGVDESDDMTIIKFEVMNRNPSTDDIFFFGNGKKITHMKNGWPYAQPQFYYQPYLIDDNENKYSAEGNFVAGDIAQYFYDPYEGSYGADATYKYKLPPMTKTQGQFLFPKVKIGKHIKLVVPGISGWTQDMFVNNLLLPGAADEVKHEEQQPEVDVSKVEVHPAVEPENIKLAGIRKVDFNKITFNSTECNKSFKIGKKIRLKRGEFKNKNARIEINQILFGDVTGDGIEEAVVEMVCEPIPNNNAFLNETHIYKLVKGAAKDIGTITDSTVSKDYRRFYPNRMLWSVRISSIRNNEVIVGAVADGPHCCPEHNVTFTYRYNGSSFVLTKAPVVTKFSK